MKRSIRITSVLLAALMLMSVFTGCSDTKKKKLADKANGKTELVYYVWGDDSEVSIIQKIVNGFEAQNPDVKVSIERAGGDYYSMLQTRFAGGNAPDIFFMESGEIQSYLSQKLLLPLDSYVNKSTKIKASDLWSINSAYRYDGKKTGSGTLYALIKDWSPDFMLFYNKDQFKAAGIPELSETQPITWDEYMSIAQKLTIRNSNGSIKRYGTTMDNVPYKHLYELVNMTGSTMFSSDWKHFNYKDAGVRKAFQYFVDLQYGKNAPAEYTSASTASVGGERFLSGDVSMVFYGRYAYTAYGWDKANFNIGIAPPPVPQAGMKATAASSGMVANAISAQTQSPEAAWKFVEYYMSDGMKEISSTGFNIPGNKTVALSDFLNASDTKTKSVNKLFLDAGQNYTYALEYNPYISENRFETLLGNDMSLVLEGKQSLDTALKNAAAKIDDAIANSSTK